MVSQQGDAPTSCEISFSLVSIPLVWASPLLSNPSLWLFSARGAGARHEEAQEV